VLRAIAIARRRRLPVLLRGESHLSSHSRGPARELLKTALLRPLFRAIAGFLAIGTLNRAYYRHYGVGDERLHEMPYAVDNAFFREAADASAPRREAFRRALGFEPGRPVVLFASKLIDRKRPADALAAHRRLRGALPPERQPYLLVVGDGPLRGALQETARDDTSVRFAGFANQSELPAFYDLCDAFVLPSEHEPWGLVVNEVMNAGRPVVVSDDVGAGPDLVTNGETGFVFPVGDVDALAGRLVAILSEPAHGKRMGRAARERVARLDFDADRRGLLAALRAVLPSRDVSRAGA
jgi:glycosyltransferase involved in cell wall biosynthesis